MNVTLEWGTATAPNNGDVDGNGQVDVDDFLLAIVSWGACREIVNGETTFVVSDMSAAPSPEGAVLVWSSELLSVAADHL